jgi:DNA invertase Pin-like site-specific DNA recombinase
VVVRRINKYKIFFRRVSSLNQDLAMQVSADALYRKNYLSEEIIIIEEDGVSANKLGIDQRPEMERIIQLIINNQVEIIYAFDRSRLFRDFYEASYFTSLCKKHNVKVFFTSTGDGQPQSTNSILLEGVLNIVSDEEGKNIARRTDSARKRFPPRKLGYIKEKDPKQYIKAPTVQEPLSLFFSKIQNVKSHKEIEVILKYFNKILKTNSNQLLKITQDPFYAGYDLTKGQNKLSHVQPYITYQELQSLQAQNNVVNSYIELDLTLKKQNTYKVSCGTCGKSMIFKYNVLEPKAWYSCSRGHTKVIITTEKLSLILASSLKKIIDHLDTNLLINDSRRFFDQVRKSINGKLETVEMKKHALMEKIILQTDDITNWRENPQYNELINLENVQKEFLFVLDKKKHLLLENVRLVELVKEYLDKCRLANPYFLYSMLIQKIEVYPNEIRLEVNKFNYLQDFSKQYILNGDVLE